MGFFSNLFGKKNNKKDEKTEDTALFYAQQDERMQAAMLEAQQSFKYFWRELYWEYRRIVPAHDFAMVKISFEQQMKGQDDPVVEHMWINNIQFDGEVIKGELVNAPHQLTNITKGDSVSRKKEEIGDWMMSMLGKTYGGFTIHAMRSVMSHNERMAHDKAWGLNFGDFNDILLVHEQKEHPENLIDHPMAKNMEEKYREFLESNPNEPTNADENGFTTLHYEAIAGNKNLIKLLLEFGADKTIKSNTGKTAYDYAKMMGWSELLDILK